MTRPHVYYGWIVVAAGFIIMLLGYAIIVVPTGIFSAEVLSATRPEVSTQTCPHCVREGHDADATFCKFCGGKL